MIIEASAVAAAAERLDETTFTAAVELLHARQGKVVFTGVGTSGIIARKVAATMTSTGTPAMFLHPGDAVHGSLGLVAQGDVMIAISYGGETDELLALLPALRDRQVPLVAIVGNMTSTLARAAAVALDAQVSQEACPLGLAPTASTAVALAIGDALALALLEKQDVTPDRFARNHPGGRLGRQLTMTIGDVLERRGSAIPRVFADADWKMIVASITEGGSGAVVVVDAADNLLGLITDGDFRRAVEAIGPQGLMDLRADQLMTRQPVTVSPDTLVFHALQTMEVRPSQLPVLPVVDPEGQRCVGLVRIHDLVTSGVL